jgi:hypothetical protein
MTYEELVAETIRGGIGAAMRDYPADSLQLKGAIAGFEACRGKEPAELAIMLGDARDRTLQAMEARVADYWYHRCYEAEIEWVCNVVSAVLRNHGLPTIVTPTMRGVMRAAEIVGVNDEPRPSRPD